MQTLKLNAESTHLILFFTVYAESTSYGSMLRGSLVRITSQSGEKKEEKNCDDQSPSIR